MSKPLDTNLEKMLAFELKQISGQSLAKTQTPDEEVYLARTQQNDGHLAEVLAMTSSVSDLQQVRTLLYRGLLSDAEQLLNQLKTSLPNGQTKSFELELTLEEARLAFFEGRWMDCLNLCSMGLENKPFLSSLQTFLQLRSVALFELKLFTQSLRDLRTLESFQKLFPASTNNVYAKALEVKIRIYQNQFKDAREQLTKLWVSLRESGSFNLDHFLCLLRIEAHLLTLAATSDSATQTSLIKIFHTISIVASVTGEDLFRAEADLALHCLSAGSIENCDSNLLKFRRINTWVENLRSKEQTSDASLALYQKLIEIGVNENKQDSFSIEAKFIFLNHIQWLVQLKPFHIKILKSDGRMAESLAVLSQGKVQKDLYFKKLWQMKTYVPHLHDNIVYKMISRLRRELNLNIEASNGHFHLRDLIAVELFNTK